MALGNCLRDKDCKVYQGDRMLFVRKCQGVFYPGVLVVCGKQEFHQVGPKMKATLNPHSHQLERSMWLLKSKRKM